MSGRRWAPGSLLGIIVIMFALEFEETTSNFLQSARRSWGIAFVGAVAPFTVAYTVAGTRPPAHPDSAWERRRVGGTRRRDSQG